jgi:predicted ArsR family transcriptional regulator
MGRERDEDSGRYTDTYTDEEFIDAIKGEGGLAGTGEIATKVGCSHRQALNRLKELEENDIVVSKDVGRSLAWRLKNNM